MKVQIEKKEKNLVHPSNLEIGDVFIGNNTSLSDTRVFICYRIDIEAGKISAIAFDTNGDKPYTCTFDLEGWEAVLLDAILTIHE